MKVYVDVSCLDRPFDDQWQQRIRLETEAVALLFDPFASGIWRHVSSDMALVEIAAMPDRDRQRRVRSLLPGSEDIITLSPAIYRRAESLIALGFRQADATHVAAAEAQGADVLLTCDDKLLNRARRRRRRLAVEVENPVIWMRSHEDAADP